MRELTVGTTVAAGVAASILAHVAIFALAAVGLPEPLLRLFLWPGYAVPYWYWGGAREFPASLIAMVLNFLFWAVLAALAFWKLLPTGDGKGDEP